MDLVSLSRQREGRYRPLVGVKLEPLGARWVAFSPLSGETHVLNDESVAILECVTALPGGVVTEDVAAVLAEDSALAPQQLHDVIELTWTALVEAGLVTREPFDPTVRA